MTPNEIIVDEILSELDCIAVFADELLIFPAELDENVIESVEFECKIDLNHIIIYQAWI